MNPYLLKIDYVKNQLPVTFSLTFYAGHTRAGNLNEISFSRPAPVTHLQLLSNFGSAKIMVIPSLLSSTKS
mgnify:CR=1 FL=1